MTPRELFDKLSGPEPPLILDVRNADEFAHWKVEGRAIPDTLNVPYFAFIEDEAAATHKVEAWLGGRPRDLAVVCAAGGSSDYVATILASKGIAAANLEGGMVAWGRGTVVRGLPAPAGVQAWQILRFGRGCLSYVLASGHDAIVVDPHHAIDGYRAFLASQTLRLQAVFETHLHADHVSGAAALARAEGVPHYANPADFQGSTTAFETVTDRGRLGIGALRVLPVLVLHTPGHTPGSTSLLVNDGLLLTGDTVFVDGVGRPDLGGQAEAWARDLYRTLHERLATLSDEVTVLPAHSAGPHEIGADGTARGRLGEVRARNASMRLDEAAFVRQAEAGAGSAPAQYQKIRAINLGLATATDEELVELELGKNECALSRR